MSNTNQTRIILLIQGFRASESDFSRAIQKAGFAAKTVSTGRQALEWAQQHEPDLIIMDASSMRSSGARTCRRLRGIHADTPIIHCRAHGAREDTSMLADVYLEQPFTGRKLLNRMRDLLPVDLNQEEIVRFGGILFYRSKRAVETEDKGEQRLTPKLALLLEEFLRHPNQLVSRRQLMRNVWHTDYVGDTRTLDVHMRWVRECIEQDPSNPIFLRTIRGKGFILAIPKHGS